MFINCRISQRVISVIPLREHHHLALFSHYAVLFLPSSLFLKFFLCSSLYPSPVDGWMHKRHSLSYSWMSVLCTNFRFLMCYHYLLFLRFIGKFLTKCFFKTTLEKRIPNVNTSTVLWQFYMNTKHKNLSSIRITVGAKKYFLPRGCVFLQPVKTTEWGSDWKTLESIANW